jgi:hypothetical protein
MKESTRIQHKIELSTVVNTERVLLGEQDHSEDLNSCF